MPPKLFPGGIGLQKLQGQYCRGAILTPTSIYAPKTQNPTLRFPPKTAIPTTTTQTLHPYTRTYTHRDGATGSNHMHAAIAPPL
jgi:hypothetical protein